MALWTSASIRQAVRNGRRIGVGPASVAALCLALALAILALDCLTPLGIADGMLYITVLLAAPAARSPRLTGALAALCAGLVGVGYALSPTVGVTTFIPLTNRALSLGVIGTTALLVLSLQRARSRIEAQRGALERANAVLAQLARLDGLTGVCNRRCFDAQLLQEVRRAARDGRPLALLMIDIDRFKAFNDRASHPEGDRCLIQVAYAIHACLRRPADFLARYGGEEFAVILPDTDADGALRLAESVRAAVERLEVPHPDAAAHPWVTVSIGVGGVAPDAAAGGPATARALLRTADEALYRAKQAGRNRVRRIGFDDARDASAAAPVEG